MRIDAVLLAGQGFDYTRSVCIVVDVLRASSSIVTLLGRGARPLVAAGSIEEARRLHQKLAGCLLCGERGGLPPPGFDYGNSPEEFSRLELGGKGAILATSNGTRLLAAMAGAPAVLVGCLLNQRAVAEAAVLCSAAYGGSTFVLEDALGAGGIVDSVLSAGSPLEPSDAARFARDAFLTAGNDLPGAIASSYHARELIQAGLGADVAYCAQLDLSDVVP